MAYIIGIFVTILLLYLFAPPLKNLKKSKLSVAMEDVYSIDQTKKLSEMQPNSLEYRLAASGLNWKPATFRVVTILGGLGATLLAWAFLPGIPAITAGILVYYAPTAIMSDRVKGRGREIDKLLPIAIGRITAGLATGASVPDVLDDVAVTLELEGKNSLSPEFTLTAAELRSKERTEALQNLARRSPSVSLANLAYLLEGYIESGGGKYNEVLSQSGKRIQQILEARNQTIAKAGDAMTSAKTIPFVLVCVLAFLAQDPTTQDSLRSLPVQLVLGVAIACMVSGFVIMRSMVQEAA
jgi:Flp pilus assembly protein TadB